MANQITLDTQEFLKVIRRLKPKRVNKLVRADRLYIAYLEGESVFCTSGVETRCPVLTADWDGYASVPFGRMLPFLRVNPAGSQVSIVCADGKAKIDTWSMPAQWAATPPWISAASIEAHFFDDLPRAKVELMFCPKCGKQKGAVLDIDDLPGQLAWGAAPAPNRMCQACEHKWMEL